MRKSLALAMILTACTAAAQDCIDYGDYIHTISAYQNRSMGLDLHADLAYVASDQYGLRILDVADPGDPRFVGELVLPGNALDVAYWNNLAYVAARTGGLQIVNVVDPAAPFIMGSMDLYGFARFVHYRDGLLYAIAGALHILDLSTPWEPVELGRYTPSFGIYGADFSDDHAYLACWDEGLVVVDISDSNLPTQVSSLDIGGVAFDVAISGVHAYVTDYLGGLLVVDISDPLDCAIIAEVTLIGQFLDWGQGAQVEISGSHAYVGTKTAGVQIVDISTPLMPLLLGGVGSAGDIKDLAVRGGDVFATNITELQVVDASEPSQPAFEQIDICGYTYGVHAHGEYAYTVNGPAGLNICDLDGPGGPQIVGNVSTSSSALAAAIHYPLAYILCDGGSLCIAEISDPTDPMTLVVAPLVCAAHDILYAAGHLFLAHHQAGIDVYDVSDPGAPLYVADLSLGGNAKDMAVAGDHLLAVVLNQGLVVSDIADPASPSVVAGLPLPGGIPAAVFVQGNVAFMSCSDDLHTTLTEVDIGDPVNPVILGFGSITGSSSDLAVAGNTAYLACDEYGLQIVDLADPSGYTVSGSLLMDRALRLCLSGDRILITDFLLGLKIAPRHCGELTGPIMLAPPNALRLAAPFPNPCNPRANISFVLDRTQAVELSIYDTRGRRVTRLLDDIRAAGRHELIWDGLDAQGRPQPSGVYFLRLAVPGWQEMRRLVLLK